MWGRIYLDKASVEGLTGGNKLQERFSDYLRALGDSIWEAQRNHPFVRGVGDGTLEVERLKFWVRQDYLYLIDYARVYNLAAAKARGPSFRGG